MNSPLPDSISSFFKISNGAEDSALPQCFSEHAVVNDENREYHGHEAIRAWLREARRKFTFTVEPLHVEQRHATVKVNARVAGDFPGSPVELEHVFRLSAGRIDFLKIG